MFNDFEKGNEQQEGRGRAGVSLALSVVIFGIIAAAVAGAMATAHAVVESRQRDVDIEFADMPAPEPEPEIAPPPPPPPPPPRPAARNERPAASREDLGPPDGIPDEQPSESEGELVEASGTGPVDGFVDGGGRSEEAEPAPPPAPPPPPPPPPGPPPTQERETVSRPQFLSGCRAPAVPEALHDQAATIRIEVRMLIGADGRVQDARVLEGHELVPDEVVLRCARNQVFEPARLPDGTTVPYPFRRRFVFRPDSL